MCVPSGQIVYTLKRGEVGGILYLANQKKENQETGIVPERATHHLFNFIDENNFLISYLDMPYLLSGGQKQGNFLILRKLLV